MRYEGKNTEHCDDIEQKKTDLQSQEECKESGMKKERHVVLGESSGYIVDNVSVRRWISSVRELCGYERVIIYDPKMEQDLIDEMVDDKILYPLNRPNSYLARSSVDDVARLESRTFICTSEKNPIKPRTPIYLLTSLS